ncbi:MAG: ssDNA-binding domain-containing protein [Treponema sp.]|jgi:hypothetical protein|nr:ssDNA-binding domain-containing protein [Treponema sp.]
MENGKIVSKNYFKKIKEMLLLPLKGGNSVLQQNRVGIDYSINIDIERFVYTEINQLVLQQDRKNNGYVSPLYFYINQIRHLNMGIEEGSQGVPVSFYQGKPNDNKVTEISNIGCRYYTCFNFAQIDRSYHKWKEEFLSTLIPETVNRKQSMNLQEFMKCPFKNCKHGKYYKAKDGSAIEKFTEAVSAYFNSIYIGTEYKALKLTNEEIETLIKEIDSPKPVLFSKINDASNFVVGDTK